MERNWNEQQIVAAVSAGNPDGYVEAMRWYGPQVHSLVLRLAGNPCDAEELAQDVFVKAFRSIRTFDRAKGNFACWLLSIAYHHALNHAKRPALRTVSLFDEWGEAEDADEAEWNGTDMVSDGTDAESNTLAEREERIARLEEAVQRLPDADRVLLSLHYFDGHPIADIARIVDMNPGAVATRLHRIRRKLHRMITNGSGL